MSEQTPHWEAKLPRGFLFGQTTPVTVEVDPNADHAGMVTVAARVEALYAALAPREVDGADPLSGEDTGDVLRLLDHLHRVIATLTAQEDRVIDVLRDAGISSHRTAAAMDVDHKTVLNRYVRIDKAAERGQNSLSYSETRAAELSD